MRAHHLRHLFLSLSGGSTRALLLLLIVLHAIGLRTRIADYDGPTSLRAHVRAVLDFYIRNTNWHYTIYRVHEIMIIYCNTYDG